MKSRNTAVAALVLVAAVGAAAPATGAARVARSATSTSRVAGAVAVSPTDIPSADPAGIGLLAGNPDHLLYSQSGAFEDDQAIGVRNSSELYLASADGSTKRLGVTLTDYNPYYTRVSVEGSYVSWALVGEDPVRWVNAETLAHGTRDLPSDATYLGSTPHGWAYVEGTTLYTETPGGAVASLGHPLGKASGEELTEGATGPDGLIVSDSQSRVAYVPYADPNHPVTLQTEDFSAKGLGAKGGEEYLDCSVPTVSTAMCAASWPGTFGAQFLAAERLSLSGGAPVNVDQSIDYFAASDAATATGIADVLNYQLTVSDADSSDPTVLDGRIVQAVGAFNRIIYNLVSDGADTFKSVNGPTDLPVTFLTPPAGEVDANDDVLTTGHLVWSDNAGPTSGDPTRNLWTRDVENRGGRIVLGTRRFLMPDSDYGYLAAGTTLAHSLVDRDDGDYVDTLVTTPVSSYTFSNDQTTDDYVPRLAYLSGDRALTDRGQEVINVITGRSRRIGGNVRAEALFGDEYFYILNGSVWKMNVATGKRTALSPAAVQTDDAVLFAWGDHVAYQTNPVRQSAIHVVDIRHPKLRYTVTGPGKYLAGVSNDGMLINDDGPSSADFDTKIWFRPYGARQKEWRILANGSLENPADVQMNGNVVTWLGTDAVIHAAPLPVTSDRPWFLGAPGVKHPANAATTTQILVPFSAPLTRCTVILSRGKRQVDAMPCQRAAADEGSAFVIWDGNNSGGHKVAPGSVTWRVKASNQYGSVLTDRGEKGTVSGRFTIGSH